MCILGRENAVMHLEISTKGKTFAALCINSKYKQMSNRSESRVNYWLGLGFYTRIRFQFYADTTELYFFMLIWDHVVLNYVS